MDRSTSASRSAWALSSSPSMANISKMAAKISGRSANRRWIRERIEFMAAAALSSAPCREDFSAEPVKGKANLSLHSTAQVVRAALEDLIKPP